MSGCNVILKDMISRLLGFPQWSGSLAPLRPRCCCWSVPITKLWVMALQSFLGPHTGKLKRSRASGPIKKVPCLVRNKRAGLIPLLFQQSGVSHELVPGLGSEVCIDGLDRPEVVRT